MNGQVPESAATATALMSGDKVNANTLGLSHHQRYNDCTNIEDNKVTSILRWSQLAGKIIFISH